MKQRQSISKGNQPRAARRAPEAPSPDVERDTDITAAIQTPSRETLVPNVVNKLQATHGNQFVLRLRRAADTQGIVQRDGDEKGASAPAPAKLPAPTRRPPPRPVPKQSSAPLPTPQPPEPIVLEEAQPEARERKPSKPD